MNVLIDTSVWIDYFRGGESSDKLDLLIDENLLVTNDIILAELIPFLKVRHQVKVITLLQKINRLSLEIDWSEIIEFQVKCLQHGVNSIGIPDLIIAQNAKTNHCEMYALDKHFHLLNQIIDLKLF